MGNSSEEMSNARSMAGWNFSRPWSNTAQSSAAVVGSATRFSCSASQLAYSVSWVWRCQLNHCSSPSFTRGLCVLLKSM